MNLHRRRIARLAVLSIGLAACQQAGPDPALPSAEPTTVAPIADEQPATVVHWPEDHDCRSLVAVLKHGLDSGVISDLDDTHFVLLDNQSLTAGAGRFGRSPATAPGASRAAGFFPPALCR